MHLRFYNFNSKKKKNWLQCTHKWPRCGWIELFKANISLVLAKVTSSFTFQQQTNLLLCFGSFRGSWMLKHGLAFSHVRLQNSPVSNAYLPTAGAMKSMSWPETYNNQSKQSAFNCKWCPNAAAKNKLVFTWVAPRRKGNSLAETTGKMGGQVSGKWRSPLERE